MAIVVENFKNYNIKTTRKTYAAFFPLVLEEKQQWREKKSGQKGEEKWWRKIKNKEQSTNLRSNFKTIKISKR